MFELDTPLPAFLPKLLTKSWPWFTAVAHFVVWLLLGADAAHAEKVQNLYRGVVPVETQSEADRNIGFRAALEQVLIKVSGREADIISGKLADKFSSPVGMVQSFGYRDNTDWLSHQSSRQNMTAEAAATSKSEPPRYLLEVVFSAALVEQQMQRMNLPIWGDTRPSVLLWVLVDQQKERQLIGNGDLIGLADLLLQDAQRLALPVFLPSADLQDLVAIKMDDLFALNPESVSEANLRYQPDAHVLLRVVQSGSASWNADWLIMLKQESTSGQIRGASLSGVVKALGVELAGFLSSRYAVLKSLANEANGVADTVLLLEVDRINTFEDFIGLQQHLESLPPLSSVAIDKIEGSRVFCRVQLGGTRQQLLEHIELSGLMQAKPPVPSSQHQPQNQPQPQHQSQQPQSQSIDVQALLNATSPVERFDWRGDPVSR